MTGRESGGPKEPAWEGRRRGASKVWGARTCLDLEVRAPPRRREPRRPRAPTEGPPPGPPRGKAAKGDQGAEPGRRGDEGKAAIPAWSGPNRTAARILPAAGPHLHWAGGAPSGPWRGRPSLALLPACLPGSGSLSLSPWAAQAVIGTGAPRGAVGLPTSFRRLLAWLSGMRPEGGAPARLLGFTFLRRATDRQRPPRLATSQSLAVAWAATFPASPSSSVRPAGGVGCPRSCWSFEGRDRRPGPPLVLTSRRQQQKWQEGPHHTAPRRPTQPGPLWALSALNERAARLPFPWARLPRRHCPRTSPLLGRNSGTLLSHPQRRLAPCPTLAAPSYKHRDCSRPSRTGGVVEPPYPGLACFLW